VTVITAAADARLAQVDAAVLSPLNVCIVAHMAYGALSGTGGHIGGVERQTTMLARWLAQRGHRVSMITWNEGQPHDAAIDGVRAIALCRQDHGLPGIRFFHPRWSSLIDALRAADADVYYQNCAEYVTGQVALWCRSNGRRFVYSSASDADCDPQLPLLTTRRERFLYRAGLKRADRVIVQSSRQQQMLRAHFGLDSTVIPMPSPDPSAGRPFFPVRDTRRVVWIGRICEVKRPDRLLDLADRCSGVSFDLVGPGDGSRFADATLERARSCTNVTVHGPLTSTGVGTLLSQAACLCSTSDTEGFPNTFLEAWSYAVPVLSMFDPDDVIRRNRLGWIAAGSQVLASLLEQVLADDEGRKQASANARTYFLQTHTAERVMPRFESLFADVAASRR
jgi:glycosyltransferase involved in cell wall biosynthesis